MKRRSAFTLEAVVVHYRRELLTAKNGSARICAGLAPPVNDLYRYAYTLHDLLKRELVVQELVAAAGGEVYSPDHVHGLLADGLDLYVRHVSAAAPLLRTSSHIFPFCRTRICYRGARTALPRKV